MGVVSIGNKEDVNTHELVVIITGRENGLTPVIDEVFNRSYHMLCRRHVDQNVLGKLTEMIKDEEVASRYLALKKIWVELKRPPEIIDDPKNKCGHHLRTLQGLPCSCELITRYEHLLPINLSDIYSFRMALEIGSAHPVSQEKDMDAEMRDLAELLPQISTGPISKVREMHCLAKRVLNPVLPSDPDLSTGSIFPFPDAFPYFVYPFIENWKHVEEDRNCGYRVVAYFVYGDEHQWPMDRVMGEQDKS
ncbi:hypothetical protein M9H77_31101 [Catharanthus roseus]|uniref:Uncharacterized protein n=1 Tax=Catharanthus roseus TaxID=4058 RepID=A0ACB9ZZZ5_CATRO|nr:hypothetical protein M9H77_31101 [Catharanthus roseus]